MTEKLLKDLVALLRQEKELYSSLLLTAKKKQPALIEGKLAEIEEMTKTEQILLLQVGKVEEGRQTLHQQLANRFSMPAEKLTISVLAEEAGEPLAGEIIRLQEEFLTVLEELKEINQVNSSLIKQSLDYINFSLNLLTGADAAPTYPNKGEKPGSGTAKLFDKKI